MRYFVGFLLAIGLVITVFVLIFTLTGNNNSGSKAVTANAALLGYAHTTKVTRLVVDGTITSQDTHREIQIEVGQNQTSIEILGGYNDAVINSKTYDNTAQAYDVFLHALEQAGFDKGNTDPSLGDERGACPSGRRYLMEVWDDNSRVQHLWTTSCGGGTFKGDTNQVLNLFERQIPDFDSITNNVNY